MYLLPVCTLRSSARSVEAEEEKGGSRPGSPESAWLDCMCDVGQLHLEGGEGPSFLLVGTCCGPKQLAKAQFPERSMVGGHCSERSSGYCSSRMVRPVEDQAEEASFQLERWDSAAAAEVYS